MISNPSSLDNLKSQNAAWDAKVSVSDFNEQHNLFVWPSQSTYILLYNQCCVVIGCVLKFHLLLPQRPSCRNDDTMIFWNSLDRLSETLLFKSVEVGGLSFRWDERSETTRLRLVVRSFPGFTEPWLQKLLRWWSKLLSFERASPPRFTGLIKIYLPDL